LITLAIDAMGGDHAPIEIIKGVKLALLEYSNLEVILVGKVELINSLLDHEKIPKDRIKVHHAEDVVSMGDSPLDSFKKKKNSSIREGLNLVRNKKADGFVSAGNTGAVMIASTLILGKLKNIERPAICTVLPSKTGPVVVLDMGSNADCKPKHLAQFAEMGELYAKYGLFIDNPRVALLNIGEESSKGNSLYQEAYNLMGKKSFNFIGNIESKEMLSGCADVVVCDGFVGNMILKFGEGLTKLFVDFFKTDAKKSILSKIGFLFLKPALKRFFKEYDYTEYGGAPFLGLNGLSIIAHGKSSAPAIKNAIKVGIKATESNLLNILSANI
jgi:phosphate acyltransferase